MILEVIISDYATFFLKVTADDLKYVYHGVYNSNFTEGEFVALARQYAEDVGYDASNAELVEKTEI